MCRNYSETGKEGFEAGVRLCNLEIFEDLDSESIGYRVCTRSPIWSERFLQSPSSCFKDSFLFVIGIA